jgi:two-component system, NtrC family, sensor histidine kinase HydH
MDDLTRKTREVFESEQQLRRADRLAALGQLTAGLAHEIRNPLASIRGAAEILGDAGVAPAQREEFSRILTEETRRLDEVLSNFIDYARAQKAEAAEAADPRRVVEKVVALLARQLADAGLTLDARIPESLPALAVDEGLLQQVVLNLLLNAIQATPRGGRVSVEAEADAGKKQATLRVRDSGPGIPSADAERIFDPFFTTKPHGLGLGLSIVHKIISNYRGEIRVDPGYGGGAGFIIRLPLAPK